MVPPRCNRGLPGPHSTGPPRYLAAGADCVYPIALWEPDALGAFIDACPGPVNVLALPRAPSLRELAALGAARVSWGTLLHREAMARFAAGLAELSR